MKYSSFTLMICSLLFTACCEHHHESKEAAEKKIDTVKTAGKQSAESAEGNHVKSEAAHASTKVEQGYALPRFDDGMAQSPINILSASTEKENAHEVNLNFKDQIYAVENLGHTIQLDFKEGSTISVDGKIYAFKQIHFHTPSEHLIDGITFPMEMHVVNVSSDQKEATGPAYIVLALLFKMGRENKFIKEFLNEVPAEENEKEDLKAGTVKLQDLFVGIPKKELVNYYHYKGSLTTPPFTESVDWVIRKHIFEASPGQITAIEKTEGDNARHVQALHERKVASN